ncbi:DUF255 domain-containing protein [Streptomyces cyaneofuscatus]|uniref:DUF255 domain-containing protein n=1 Tax=Streptomyces cyaneofuscatus TaxID=66883 RepID=UPI0036E314D7
MNRLANSQSPCLLQHASNPVDWWPWGEEAMQEAKRRDVPILLSVGYSSCHLACRSLEPVKLHNQVVLPWGVARR